MLRKFSIAAAVVMISTVGFSYPILSRTTLDGGLFGYDYTNSELKAYSYVDANGNTQTGKGWIVNCEDPGWHHCPKAKDLDKAAVPEHIDEIDADKADELVGYVEVEVAGGNQNGSHTVRVQVNGENFERVYTVTWSTESDGSVTTVVDYTEAPIP